VRVDERQATWAQHWCEAFRNLVSQTGLLALGVRLKESIKEPASAEVRKAADMLQEDELLENVKRLSGLLFAAEESCKEAGVDLIDLVRLASVFFDPWHMPIALQLRHNLRTMEQKAWTATALEFAEEFEDATRRYREIDPDEFDDDEPEEEAQGRPSP
jgi:hypothetical protein